MSEIFSWSNGAGKLTQERQLLAAEELRNDVCRLWFAWRFYNSLHLTGARRDKLIYVRVSFDRQTQKNEWNHHKRDIGPSCRASPTLTLESCKVCVRVFGLTTLSPLCINTEVWNLPDQDISETRVLSLYWYYHHQVWMGKDRSTTHHYCFPHPHIQTCDTCNAWAKETTAWLSASDS